MNRSNYSLRHSSARLDIPPGTRFTRLEIIKEAPGQIRAGGMMVRAFWCRCDCGVEKIVRLTSLREGKTVSCGCFHRENSGLLGKTFITHGQSKANPLYWVWAAMIGRCHNPRNKSYVRYGARGVTVCARWKDSFAAFFADVGPRPDGLTLDRIDSAGNYEPSNVRWATYTEQARNTRRNIKVEFDGKVMSLPEACERSGVSYEIARKHIKKDGQYGGLLHVV